MGLIFFILIAIAVFGAYKLFSSSDSSSSSISEPYKFVPERDPKFMEWNIEHDADITGFSIAGINFRHLDYTFVGPFDGTVKIEPDNPYDSYAVAIYKGRKKVGYIPKEYSRYVHDKIEKNGGKTTCIGYIYTFTSDDYTDKFAGKVIPDLEIKSLTTITGPSESITDE